MSECKSKWKKTLSTPLLLLLIYAISVLIRYLLASNTHLYPTVLIDEPLYISLARSIGTGKGLLYMGQPADYSSILYPLLLSPVFALFPEGTDFYQLLQFWSICLMNLSVFPAYALFKSLFNSSQKAVLLTLLTLILPDFTMGGMIMGESISYPLILYAMFFSYRFIKNGKLFDSVVIALLACLLFASKPGHVVAALSVFFIETAYAIRYRNKQRFTNSAIGFCATAVFIALYFLLISLFFQHNTSALGLYDYQTASKSGLHLGVFLKSILQYIYFFVIASGLIAPLSIITKFPFYNKEQHKFLYTILLALVTTILGTAWFVNRIEYDDPTIHIRYIAMYIPMIWAYSLLNIPTNEPKKCSQFFFDSQMFVYSLSGLIVAISLIYGCKSGVASYSQHVVSNMGLTMFRDTYISSTQGAVLSFLISVFTVFFSIILTHFKKTTLQTISICIIVFSSILNTILSYNEMYTQSNTVLVPETATFEKLINNQEYAIVYGTNFTSYHALLDANTNESVSMIYVNDLYNNMLSSEGIYEPFVPDVQRGTIPTYKTPDTTLFVIDKAAITHMQFSDSAVIHNQGDHLLFLVSISKDMPLLKSMMGGPIHHELKSGTPCIFKIFDPELQKGTVTLTWDMSLSEESEVIIFDGVNRTSFTLPAGRDTYSLQLTEPTSTITITIPEHNAQIYSYDLLL